MKLTCEGTQFEKGSSQIREENMQMSLRTFAIATSAFACATLLSFGWSEQSGVSLSVESAQARIGRPWTPLSVAGVARRQYRRAAYGYGAGVVGAGLAARAYYGGYPSGYYGAYGGYPSGYYGTYAAGGYPGAYGGYPSGYYGAYAAGGYPGAYGGYPSGYYGAYAAGGYPGDYYGAYAAGGYPGGYYGGYANRSYVTGRPTLIPRYYGW
jgi:hypothetical protein